MKKILIAVAACAACALASSQVVIVPPHEGEHMENRDMDRGDQMKRPDTMIAQQAYRADERHDDRHEEHHQHKVWVPSHSDHDHTVRGHYEWR